MSELESALQQTQDARFRLVVTDAVFSMDGEIAKLPRIGELADTYESAIMIDECHGTGVLGKRGRGAIESTGMLGQVGMDLERITLRNYFFNAWKGFRRRKRRVHYREKGNH